MKASILFVIVSLAAMQRPVSPRPAPSVRFHHLHYRVGDPGAALAPAVERLRGTRVMLPGLGVGVRVGREYLLFDREEHPAAMDIRADQVTDEARRWLMAHRIEIEAEALDRLDLSTGLPADAMFDHVAFAANDLTRVLAALKETPRSRSEQSARFTLASGATLEIVRDTIGPDAYWCPMHPDVRRPGEEKCPRCGMALVPIPPPRLGEYRMDVTMTPRAGGGASGLRLMLREPDSGKPVTTMIDVHERPLHLFIVSRDLETFAHVHPERQPNGSFVIRHDLAPGAYGVMADFLPSSGTAQLLQRVIVTPGYAGALFAEPTLPPESVEQISQGLRITLDRSDLRARRPSALRFQISDASTKQPVTDLQPFLGASGHLLVVSPDLTTAFHAHPDGAPTAGPIVMFNPVFPAPGQYKLWVQFQRKAEVVTVPFVVSVP